MTSTLNLYSQVRALEVSATLWLKRANKNEVSLPKQIQEKIKNRIPVLLGDNIMDINMVDTDKSFIKIGFLDEKVEERMETFLDNFDLVCTENTSYDELLEYISKKVKGINKNG